MINYEMYCRIKQYAQAENLVPSQIAAATGLDERTVSYWLGKERYEQRLKTKRTSCLDPYKDYILRQIEKHPFTGQQIFLRLKEQGFKGGYSTVKAYLKIVRPKRQTAYLTLSFAPGECAQVDWGSFGTVRVGGTTRRLSFFLMVLCHSRMLYLEFTVLQKMEHFLNCHKNAFEFFGAVPERIMVDNLKSAVLQRLAGADPVFNPHYADFAKHYGFGISPCNPGKGNEKGRVENGVGYVKKNLLAGLEPCDFSTITPLARQWMDSVANVRIHGETKKRPLDIFQTEKVALRTLPVMAYDIGTVTTVRASSQFRIVLDTNRYSVPAEYASTRLILKAYPDILCVYHEDKLVARHVRSYDRNRDFEHPDHPKELLAKKRRASDTRMYATFISISARAESYYNELSARVFNPRHHVRLIVALIEIHGKEAVARAMEDAFEFHAFRAEYIANLLEQQLCKPEPPGALQLTRRSDLLDIELQAPDLSVYDNYSEEPGDEKPKT